MKLTIGDTDTGVRRGEAASTTCKKGEWVRQPGGRVGHGHHRRLYGRATGVARPVGVGGWHGPFPLPTIGMKFLLFVSHNLLKLNLWENDVIQFFHNYLTFAFCEKASLSSVWRFFQASPSRTLIALKIYDIC